MGTGPGQVEETCSPAPKTCENVGLEPRLHLGTKGAWGASYPKKAEPRDRPCRRPGALAGPAEAFPCWRRGGLTGIHRGYRPRGGGRIRPLSEMQGCCSDSVPRTPPTGRAGRAHASVGRHPILHPAPMPLSWHPERRLCRGMDRWPYLHPSRELTCQTAASPHSRRNPAGPSPGWPGQACGRGPPR